MASLAAAAQPPWHAVFVALGGVGDVVPLAHLAGQCAALLEQRSARVRIIVPARFVNHPLLCAHARRLDIVGVDIPTFHGDGGSETAAATAELDALAAACAGARRLVFNLFTVEAFHVADALGCPCACASPGDHPDGDGDDMAAAAREDALRRAVPFLHATLQRQAAAAASADNTPKALEHAARWMLPLFHPRWRAWRTARGLHPVPFARAVAFEGARPRGPLDVPLLFGFCPCLARGRRRIGRLCGYWQQEAEAVQGGALPEGLGPFLEEGTRVLVTLGTPLALGLVSSTSLFEIVVGAARLARRQAGGSTAPPPRFVLQLPVAGSAAQQHACCLVTGPFPHAAALAAGHFDCVVHHGGAGTTGACLRAGVAQCVLPVAFDQGAWSARVAAAGVGVACPAAVVQALDPQAGGRSVATEAAAQALLDAVRAATRPTVVAAAKQLAAGGACPCKRHCDAGVAAAVIVLDAGK